ncbi:DJ-1/PfpI family protein [Candidatus Falkowbacteria bacterium]|jgi:protease I|nr:DJ-1/PfpI family protein [Candidatus Falkowbacteria bacterium]MBT5503850.1 DJ-1/PfpI family protein [Candidatus Falkowbacteria bacterium]MBT6574393.1 DJ-1/PfpI family protein [Candidatus Falkowbacteria bacterium]MBT7348910.1 DJ-1/PfpI family protein [Candidatus Falkowbacteria bacterium]MBT7501266.1 DJ-1/PfpI family protein [Candidatus Falkowbacteria bacterium]
MKVVMIIAQKDFRDEELFDTKVALEQRGVEVDVATAEDKTAYGVLGGQISPNLTFGEIQPEKFDSIVLVGGAGAYDLIENKQIHILVKEFIEQNKIVAAICIAPAILSRAGVLNGKQSTIHISGVDYFQGTGVDYVEQDVVVDGWLITANGPAAASRFGQEIANKLKVYKV